MRLRAARPALALSLLALAGCSVGHTSFMAPHGTVAAAQRSWFFLSILIMMTVVGPVLVLTPFFAWRYRHGRRDSRYRPDWGAASLGYEAAVWGPPIVIVAALSWLVYGPERAIDPDRPVSARPAEEVEVVALDWKWLFIYPREGIAAVGTLAFPTDHQLSLRLTSDATMQSFLVPALGSQIYAMAGMVTRLHLDADRPVSITGENTQFNGDGFARDRFAVRAMAPADFRRWSASVRAGGIALDAARYATLHKKGSIAEARGALHATGGPPGELWFSSVPPGLFGHIVAHYDGPARDAIAAMDGG